MIAPLHRHARPHRSRHGERGISFVEVMVAIFILALATSIIIFTIPKPAAEPREAIQLRSMLERASDRARMTGTPAGLVLADDSYQVSDWREGAWQPVPGTRTALGPRLQLAVVPGPQRAADDPPEGWPVIVFDPLGHTPAIDLNITIGRETQRLSIVTGGDVRLEAPDA